MKTLKLHALGEKDHLQILKSKYFKLFKIINSTRILNKASRIKERAKLRKQFYQEKSQVKKNLY